MAYFHLHKGKERHLGKNLGAFFHARKQKGNEMKEKNEKTNDEVIMVTDDTGMQLYLSEKAANRLSWILTGLFALISLPVFILAFMCV